MRRALTRTLTALLIFALAFAAGHAVSTRLRPDLLRSEIELQLSKLLRSKVRLTSAALAFRGGLLVHGAGLSLYSEAEGDPALTVRAVSAAIDLPSLALGRLRLSWLRLEGVDFRIEHHEDGSWSPDPIASLAQRPGESGEQLEQNLVLLRAFEFATRWLLERPIVARRVELVDSRLTFLDSQAAVPGELQVDGPYELRLDSIHGVLSHHWFSGEAELELRARLADANGVVGDLEAQGQHRGDQGFRLAVAGTQLSLAALSPFARELEEHARLAGILDGVAVFRTGADRHGRLELDWIIHDLDSVLPLGATLIPVASRRGTLQANIEIHSNRLRVNSARIGGDQVKLVLSGSAERPLRESARMRISGSLRGVEMEEVRSFLAALPEKDRETLSQLLGRIQTGHIHELGGTGSASIAEWRRLLSGELINLPAGFVLAADVSEVTLETGENDRLLDVGAHVEWSANRFEVRNGRGRWNDTVLPKLNLVVEDASNLFLGTPGSTTLRAVASPLPGLRTLLEALLANNASDAREAPESSDPLAAPPTLQLELSRIDHPVLRWPVDDARVSVEPSKQGGQLNLLARWAGVPVRAEAVWVTDTRVDIHVTVEKPGSEDVGASRTPAHPRPAMAAGDATAVATEPEPWAIGHFEIGSSLTGRFPFEAIGGEFRAVASRLELSDVRVSLPRQGHIEGSLAAELGQEGVAGVDLGFRMSDAEVATIARAIGLPEEFATGTASASGRVAGQLRSGAPLLSELRGAVEFEARDGALRMQIPLLVAIAQATEGFNPLAEREAVHYEVASARLDLEDSRIRTEQFYLEGPMRVFASGEIVLDQPSAGSIDAVVGVFLFRQIDSLLGKIPLLGALVSDKGLLGAYFRVHGPLGEPEIEALPLSSLAEAVPDVIKAPLKVLGFVLRGPGTDDPRREGSLGHEELGPELRLPAPAAAAGAPDPGPSP